MNDTIPVTHAEHVADLQRRLDNAEACARQRAKVMDLRADRIRELEAELAASQRAVIETGKALRTAEEDRSRLQAKCGDLLERARTAEADARSAEDELTKSLLETEEERSQHAVTIAQRDLMRRAFDDCNRMAAETERKLEDALARGEEWRLAVLETAKERDAALIRAEAAEAEVSAWETSDCGADVLSLEAKLEEARRERGIVGGQLLAIKDILESEDEEDPDVIVSLITDLLYGRFE